MLRCADLFSGIGGFSLALDCFACVETAVYCDICPMSRAILQRRMDDGHLPRAPIHEDVATLTFNVGEVDMIVGGFPCTGFSSLGRSEGIRNQGSGLVSHVYRLVEESRAAIVFLENVPRIVRFAEYPDICRRFDRMGYTMHWLRLKASQFGAPHHRGRWFCLGVRRDKTPLPPLTLRQSLDRVPLFDWHREPTRMLVGPKPAMYRARNVALGNTVVPACARVAFILLWTGCQRGLDDVLGQNAWEYARPEASGKRPRGSVHCGTFVNDTVVPLHAHPDILTYRVAVSIPREFILDPAVFTSPKPRKQTRIQAPTMDTPHRMTYLSTPRTIIQPANYLTRRSYKDVGTQLRFERSTQNRQNLVDTRYIEWMQGYPAGWTDIALQ